MKIGRRNFLKFLSSAIAGTQIKSPSGIHRSDTFFADEKLGFGFKIPHGWHLETFRDDFSELLGGQRLAEPYADDHELFAELTEGIMATLSKYPIDKKGPEKFSPSITFFKDNDDCLRDYDSLNDFVNSAVNGFAEILTDYHCFRKPHLVARDDCAMVASKSSFLFEHEKIQPVPIENETFVVHHDRCVYTIHLYDSPYLADTAQEEFHLFKESLHIV